MQNTLKKQNLSVIPRQLSASERMDAEVKHGHLQPVTCMPSLKVTPQEVGCKLFSGMCRECRAVRLCGGAALLQGEVGLLPACDKRLGQGTEGTDVPRALPGLFTSSGTPSAGAGAGCRVILGETGIPSAMVHP